MTDVAKAKVVFDDPHGAAGNMQEAERYFTLAQDVCSRHGLTPEALIVLPFLD